MNLMLENTWKKFSKKILKDSTDPVIATWINSFDFVGGEELTSGELELSFKVPSPLHESYFREKVAHLINEEFSATYNKNIKLKIDMSTKKSEDLEQKNLFNQINRSAQEQIIPFNTDYTFNSFVVGNNNHFAHAASFKVAQNPGNTDSNPFFSVALLVWAKLI